MEEIRSDIKGFDDKLEGFLELRNIKEINHALKLFLTPIENLSEEGRRIFNNAKHDLAKKYNWDKPYYFYVLDTILSYVFHLVSSCVLV